MISNFGRKILTWIGEDNFEKRRNIGGVIFLLLLILEVFDKNFISNPFHFAALYFAWHCFRCSREADREVALKKEAHGSYYQSDTSNRILALGGIICLAVFSIYTSNRDFVQLKYSLSRECALKEKTTDGFIECLAQRNTANQNSR